MALVTVLAVLLASGGGADGSAPEEAPFAGALYALALAPEVQYVQDVSGVGLVNAEVTSHGELVGTVTEDARTYQLLQVGGRLYLKPPAAGLPNVSNKAESAAMQGKWITGSTVDNLLGSIPQQLVSPPELAARLAAALANSKAYPPPGAPGTLIDGVPVLEAHTSLGNLYVTRNAPYRIVRLVPAAATPAAATPVAATSAPSAVETRYQPAAGVPGLATVDATGRGTASGPAAASMDFPSQQPGAVTGTYSQLENDTRDLTGAINTGLKFSVDGNGQISCNGAGCNITVSVTNSIDPGSSGSTITSGSVRAVLDATISIEGKPTPGCTGQGELPVNGTGNMSCTDGGAGAVFSAVEAQEKAQAESQSAAEGGAAVPYYIHYQAQYYVYASVQVDTTQLTQDEQQESAADTAPGGCGDTAMLAPGRLAPGRLAPGTLAPGTLAPGRLAPGTLAPGTLAPGTLAPGGAKAIAPVPPRGGPARVHVVSDIHGTAGTTPPCWIAPGSLPPNEELALDNTLAHIKNGTMPSDATATRWGAAFKNYPPQGTNSPALPGGSGNSSPYREYRVSPPPGVSGAGPLRIVVNTQNGEIYYTWTHYGDSDYPPFVRIR